MSSNLFVVVGGSNVVKTQLENRRVEDADGVASGEQDFTDKIKYFNSKAGNVEETVVASEELSSDLSANQAGAKLYYAKSYHNGKVVSVGFEQVDAAAFEDESASAIEAKMMGYTELNR